MTVLQRLAGLALVLALTGCDGKDEPPDEAPVARGPDAPSPVPEGGSAARPKQPATPQPGQPRGGGGGTGDGGTAKPAPAPAKPAPAPAEPGAPAKKTPKPVAPAPSGITQVSSAKWTVTRSLVDHWKDDPYRVSNVRESGEGWALAGVRQRAAYHLGMRNGDVIIEANGHKLDTRAQLFAAYLDLKNDTEFTVVFLRDGQRMVHHYQIVQ